MIIHIYPLVQKHQGKVPGDEFLAEVRLVEQGIRIECYDKKLKEKLQDVFSLPMIKRTPVFQEHGIIAYQEEPVQPFTEEFFDEILFSLHKQGLYGKINR